MKGKYRIFLYIALLVVVVIIAASLLDDPNTIDTDYSKIVEYFNNIESDDANAIAIKTFKLNSNNKLTATLTDGKKISYTIQDREVFLSDCWENAKKLGTGNYDLTEPTTFPAWIAIIPYLLIAGLFIFMLIFVMRQSANINGKSITNFGKSHAKVSTNNKTKVLFSDVAGADEEKQELVEVVEFLKNPDKFTKLGAKIPHGVLLIGPPGTGKTLLAKAVAGEADVPFYSISGSDFVEMYVGVGASRVRDLFETARKHPASIIFIDEIDAVGRHRGAGLGGGHDEREQTLNQLLVEMDGFAGNEGTIVMAATNRPDILDPALLRPGRFDRQITVNYPDIRGREEILKVHAKNKPFENDVDLSTIAKSTSGFTGADLANLLNEAALLAARRGKSLIGMNDIEDATMKIIVGTQKKSMKIKDEEKYKTAIHEAGHAVLMHLLPTQSPVHQISIIPSGKALGYTLNLPKEDKYSIYKNELFEEITALLGGRIAESICFNDISGGASNDIQRATEIARKMVTQLGMSDLLGTVTYGTGHTEVFLGRELGEEKNYSDKTAYEIDEEIRKIISNAYAKGEEILRNNIDKLEFIAKFLVKNETMDEIQFNALMTSEVQPTFEELEQMMDERRKKSIEENRIQEEKNKSEIKKEAEIQKDNSESENETQSSDKPRNFFSED